MKKAKRPGTPVSETLKRSIKRNMRRGVLGSKNSTASCDGPTASMTGLDLSGINPIGYSTMGNGAWAWHVMPDGWYERWVPKPRKGESPGHWLVRVASDLVLPTQWATQPNGWVESGVVAAVNAHLAHLDWV